MRLFPCIASMRTRPMCLCLWHLHLPGATRVGAMCYTCWCYVLPTVHTPHVPLYGIVWYGRVWYGMGEVCEGAPVAMGGWVFTHRHNLVSWLCCCFAALTPAGPTCYTCWRMATPYSLRHAPLLSQCMALPMCVRSHACCTRWRRTGGLLLILASRSRLPTQSTRTVKRTLPIQPARAVPWDTRRTRAVTSSSHAATAAGSLEAVLGQPGVPVTLYCGAGGVQQ